MKTSFFIAMATLAAYTAQAQTLPLPLDAEERMLWLSEMVDQYQFGVEAGAGDAAPCVQADVERWRNDVLAACTDDACKEVALINRLSELHAIQPGASQLSDWEPSPGPSLIAVLAPEISTEESGADLSLAPDMEVEGALIHAGDNAEHMGLALRSDNDEDHVLVFDFDIGNQPVHGTLQALIGVDPQARYLARGTADIAPDGVANFSPLQCRFVYHIPAE